MELKGRNVVVTGGSQGIGEQIGREFAAAGANVLLVARSETKLAAVASSIGGSYLAADLTDADQVETLVDRALAELGHIDVFVNNAGIETNSAFVEVTTAELRTLARLNFEAPLILTNQVVRHMLGRGMGHVVQMSSVAGAIPFPGLAAYAGSKAGITNFTETLRLELAGTGVNLTVVAPGPVDTEMWDRLEDDAPYVAPALRRFKQLLFLPKLSPRKVAKATVDAVATDKRFVRLPRRYGGYHALNNAPRRLVEGALLGVDLTPPTPPPSEGSLVWPTDNALSARWPLYTRGNVGEVFPEVVLPLTWDVFGKAAEDGWRAAFRTMGLLAPSDLSPSEDMVILGVFGGYCYINASYVRMLGVRAPGGTVEVIDNQFFGESDAPPYVPRKGDKNPKASLALGRTVLRLLGTKALPALDDDKAAVAAYEAAHPGNDAEDADLLAHITGLTPLFERLFERHIENTFSVALTLGAVVDLCAKVGLDEELVSLLGGIGDVESAAPSAAMWSLARGVNENAAIGAAFDDGIPGLLGRLRELGSATDWVATFDQFLADFGSRGPNEWDIGADPWALRPELALAAIGRIRRAPAEHAPAEQAARLAEARNASIARVRGALSAPDRVMFDKALRATTLYSQGRERSKTTIIRAVHSAREAQAELARRVAARGGPQLRRHTCLLGLDDFRSLLDNPTAFDALIDERAALYDDLASRVPPFILDGEVPPIDTWQRRDREAESFAVGDQLQAIAGCPGVARGRARVVLDAGDPGGLEPGEILVAPITDPSWTPLFLAASGVVVDVGATMSHAVIVSRELGIPCVVSAVGATERIPDGSLIELDGNNGTVTILELPD